MDNTNKINIFLAIFFGIIIVVIGGYLVLNTQKDESVQGENTITPTASRQEGTFFVDDSLSVCTYEEKPVVYLFSTTWCSHCQWIKETFDRVAKEYMGQDKIVAYHWEVDTGDNTLTDKTENSVPTDAMNIYKQFNPQSSIPTFVIGCQYWRVGNGYEGTDDLASEEAEFRKLFDTVIEEAAN